MPPQYPNWLMAPLLELTRRTPGSQALTQDEFNKKYYSGSIDPATGSTRHYYDFDFEKEFLDDTKYHRKGGSALFGSRRKTGYQFYEPTDAYTAYVDTVKKQEAGEDLGIVESNIFDPESYLRAVYEARGDDPEDAPYAGSFTAFTPEMFEKTKTGYYQEDIEEDRESLIDSLVGKVEKAKSAGGMFAGYGKREGEVDVAQGSYHSGVGDIYTGIQSERSQALQNIYDVLSQYEKA